MEYDCPMARDCIVLLAFCARNPCSKLSMRKLAEHCGIPPQTIKDILREAAEAEHNGQDSLLHVVAYKYNYEIKLGTWNKGRGHTRGPVLYCVYRGPSKWDKL